MNKIGEMSYFWRLIFTISCSFLLACTNESKVKSLSLDGAESYFAEFLHQESEKNIQGKATYKSNYISAVKAQTEYEVEKIDIQSQQATAVVIIKSWPDKVRWSALDIVDKRSNENGYSLNISDALGMIGAQLHLDPTKPIMKVIIKMTRESGEWKTISVEKQNLKKDSPSSN